MRITRNMFDWMVASAPLLLLLAILWFSFDSEPKVADFFASYSRAHQGLTSFFTYVTNYGNAVFYAVYLWLLVKAWRNRDSKLARFVGVYIILQLVIALATVRFLKTTIGRPRPGTETLFEPMSHRGAMHSLPSGHTTEITGAALPFALRSKRTAVSLLMGTVIGLVGFSRIYLGWHHPSDVFFGWLLGSVTGFGINILAPKEANE